MTQGYFLWPESRVLRAIVSAPKLPSVDKVERKLREMFPSGYPVICSSGRSAIVLSLVASNMSRSDFVGVFPYASHCVLDAVSRVATPLAGPTSTTAALRLVYHQWGFVQEKCLPSNSIEDCVDTLCVPGASLFPGGGRFEIWSLPKILGTTSGGVLWCRDARTAEAIRILRNERGGGISPWLLRLFAKHYPKAYYYWQGVEGNFGYVSCLQTGEYLHAFQNWENVVSDRLKKIDVIWPYAIKTLQKPIDRLPSVIPMPLYLPENTLKEIGVISGYRTFEMVNDKGVHSMEKVAPIPIHQDVPVNWLEKLVKGISKCNG